MQLTTFIDFNYCNMNQRQSDTFFVQTYTFNVKNFTRNGNGLENRTTHALGSQHHCCLQQRKGYISNHIKVTDMFKLACWQTRLPKPFPLVSVPASMHLITLECVCKHQWRCAVKWFCSESSICGKTNKFEILSFNPYF